MNTTSVDTELTELFIQGQKIISELKSLRHTTTLNEELLTQIFLKLDAIELDPTSDSRGFKRTIVHTLSNALKD